MSGLDIYLHIYFSALSLLYGLWSTIATLGNDAQQSSITIQYHLDFPVLGDMLNPKARAKVSPTEALETESREGHLEESLNDAIQEFLFGQKS